MAKSSLFFLVFTPGIIVVTVRATCEKYGGQMSDCTDGFPTLFHIDKLTDNVGNLETRDRRQVVIPDINFSCNGTITRWIVGAEWKGKTNAHTELQIWRRTSTTNQYMKVNGTNITVSGWNTSQVYELETSLAFQEGDVLGYFQPRDMRSQLNLYLERSGRITTYHTQLGNNDVTPPATGAVFSIDGADDDDDRYPLIAVRTDPPDCGCGFMSVERVYALLGIPPLQTGMRKNFNNRQLIFPSINFTCYGEVVKWIMAGEWRGDGGSRFPELQIWRSSGDSTYQKQSSTVIDTEEEDDGVYQFPVAPPLPFQPGDILGLRQPRDSDSRLQVRYDNRGDSVYYGTRANQNNIFNISGSGVTTSTDIPLVTVVIVEHNPSSSFIHQTSSAIVSTMMSSLIQTSLPTVSRVTSVSPSATTDTSKMSISSTRKITIMSSVKNNIDSTAVGESIAMTTTTDTTETILSFTSLTKEPLGTTTIIVNPSLQPLRSSSTGLTKLPQSPTIPPPDFDRPQPVDHPESGGLGTGAVVGLVLGLIILFLLAAVTASLFLIFFQKKRYRKQDLNNSGLNNPNYAGVDTVKGARYTKSTETVKVHANPCDNEYAIPDIAQHYETPVLSDGQWGIYVPTTMQRSLYQQADDIYSCVGLKPVVKDGEGGGEEEEAFFTQSDLYWTPASDTAGLYDQLSRNHFREIQRDRVQIKQHLGSGQFGTVNKGVWQCPRGEREVAIKLLQAGAMEDSRVKFLREAAIMGQFSHRNIISLFGVVTLGDPVMIVMELMPDGDLRDNLLNMKPIPGELPPNTLSQLLLDFCHQISAGMKYLSDKAFVHRDLAARNVLVSGKTCKIADFGMARDLEESSYYVSQGGQIPVKWTAPEAVQFKKYSTASDVWSFGCLVYEIWSLGHKPFEGYTNVEAIRLVQTGHRLAPPPGCPREIYQLMMYCWNPEPSERPRFSQLLQTLSLSEHDLLHIPEEVTRGYPQASVLGAPLEAGSDAYPDLQNSYTK